MVKADHSSEIHIFDRSRLKQNRARVASRFSDYDFLHVWAKKQLQSRLSDIMRRFSKTVQIGARGGPVLDDIITMDITPSFNPSVVADEEFLPFGDHALDAVLSPLSLHAVNDLPGALSQIKRSLKPDGLFMAALFGGETLYELRESLTAAEILHKGGASPRVFPFADKQQAGALLQRAGFALPVVDSEIVSVTYESMFKLLHDLRGMGESNIIAARDKGYAGKSYFMEAAQHYHQNYAQSDGRILASFEVIFLLGWAPHESQQKPLRPGSAQNRLADVLQTKETKL